MYCSHLVTACNDQHAELTRTGMKPTEYMGGLMAAIHSRLRSASLSAVDAAAAALPLAASG